MAIYGIIGFRRYIIMKLTISKSKNSVHFYVQKSVRLKNGGTTSVMVENLGSLEEVKTKAGGKDPYEWAHAYVDELNRKQYEEKKEIILRYSPSKLIKTGEQKCYNCGYLFLTKIINSLGVSDICKDISKRHSFEYDLGDILTGLICTRILYPSSKLASRRLAENFLEQPSYQLHDVYRALSVLSEESDFLQAELYKNSQKVCPRRNDILYYDCTNYFFELEEASGVRAYGKSKESRPLPIVGMGLFVDHDGVPLAFDIYPGNKNEQPTLKPLEKKILKDYELGEIIVCTDAGLSSKANRKFNDKEIRGIRKRSFITTQSVKGLPESLKAFALSDDGWKLDGSDHEYRISELSEKDDYDRIFYKEKWITEDLTEKQKEQGVKPLEQRLIVSYSIKYKRYLEKIRTGQVERARKMLDTGSCKRNGKNQNDPRRFIGHEVVTKDGEVCDVDIPYLDETVIADEAKYDGFYAVCTSIEDMNTADIIKINADRWQIEECFRIMKTEFRARPVYVQRDDRIKAHFLTCFMALMVYRILEKQLGEKFTVEQLVETLKGMNMQRPGEKLGYIPAYTRTEITDALHENAGFRTDYEILTDLSMKKVIRSTKK